MNNDYTFTYNTNPTKENITYAFQRLITPLVIATYFKPYKESWDKFNKVLHIVVNWAIIYDDTNDLSKIDFNQFKEIRQQLFELDSLYLSADGLYAEEAYEWFLQLQILLENIKGE